ncbi:leucine-rich repeat flightless-interacting protein 1 isoform X8 [Anolis carolinensis]|uniref:leucine-rich repeat flightless-interacting protein 1 isoform X8 n=1 Tax=Anolis carolinensis TaxID=28377 RepID=UPI002F2B681D
MEAMGSQQQQPGPTGRKRLPNRERPAAEDDALNQIAREAEARLAAKRAARAEAREIRMKELERQQKEIYQVQKKYYGLDTKFGDIEQWMEDSERYTRKSRRNASASDEDERMSVGSRGSLRASCYSDLSLHSTGFPSKSQPSSQNGNRPSLLYSDALPARSYRASLYDENLNTGTRRYSASSSRPPSEYSCYLGSGSRASSRASSARASPVVEERPEKDFEKGVRTVSSLSAATLASLGGTSSRRGSGDTSISVDTEASIREIKDINELKDQIQDVEGKYKQGLKEMKDSLAEVEEKYKKAMVSNAQLDNEKTNFMYQVDTLKDALLELEEQLAESKRQYDEKSKDFEREKHAHTILQFQFVEVKEALKQREELLAALERQKEFFDSIRSERDDLREEVVLLKEQLKQHGIIPNLEVATNGETSGGLHNDGLSSSSKMVSGTSHIPGGPGDGTLGRANEVEMKNEIVENVGKREILQNTEHEEHTEETKEQEIVQECSEIKTLHADENAEAEKITEGKVASTLVLNSGLEEPAKSHTEHVPEIVYSPKNSDVVEFCIEGGSLGYTSEGKELNENVVNKISNQSKETAPGIEVGETIHTGLEMLPQKQNNEKLTDIVVDVGEDNNNEIFQEALDFVNDSQKAASSHSETPGLAGDMLSKTSAIHSDIKLSENKIIEVDLLIKDQGITKTDKEQQDENEADGTDEDDEMENLVQQQSDKIDSPVEHTETACTREQTPGDLMEEQKQVEVEETQTSSSNHDAFTEEESIEQQLEASEDNLGESLAKGTEQRETVLRIQEENAVSEKNKQNSMTDVHPENIVVDGVEQNECQMHERKQLDLKDDSRKGSEIKPEIVNDEKTLVEIPSKIEDDDADSQDNPAFTEEPRTERQDESFPGLDAVSEKNDKQNSMTDVHPENIVVDGVEQNECQTHERKKLDLEDDSRKGNKINFEIINDEKTPVEIPSKSEDDDADSQDNPACTEEPRAEKQDEKFPGLDVAANILIEDVEEVCKRNEEDVNFTKTEEKVIDAVPDLEAVDLKLEKAEFSNQKRDSDSEDEHLEEYHEASDFSESSFGELKTTERSEDQGNELEINDQKTQETDGTAESALQDVIKKDNENREKERPVGEDKKEKDYQISMDEMGSENVLTKTKNTQQEKEADHLQTDAAISEPPEAQSEMLEDSNKRILEEISSEQIAAYTLEQLEKLGLAQQESQPDTQVGRKGKGKSREDCVMS